jgi:hypothetical protein
VGNLIPNITTSPSTQPSGIVDFAFSSRVNPCITDPHLTLAVITIDFCFALPQTTLPANTQKNLLSTVSTAETPAKSTPPPLITLAALDALSSAKLSVLGTQLAQTPSPSMVSPATPNSLLHNLPT